jgi:hypothetical protein
MAITLARFLRSGKHDESTNHGTQDGFDAIPLRTLEWLSLPVLAVPFWGRPAVVAESADAESSKHRNHQLPKIAPVCDGMDLTFTPSR